ncbi:MAG: methyltransferase domain-containing protein [Pseudomonadota bacterium]
MTGDAQAETLKDVFAEDYLYFHERFLDGPRADQEATIAAALTNAPIGGRVLDLCCGHGRLSRRFAAGGYAVDGIDLSAFFIATAQAADAKTAYVQADALATPYADASFDAAYCWFTSFGLQEDADLQAMLREARRVLKPGARLAIDLANRDLLITGFQQFNVLNRDGDMLIDRNEMDVVSGKLWITRTSRRSGRPTATRRFFLRQFTPPEIAGWMTAAGFADIRFAGDGGREFGPTSLAMIVVGTAV